MGTSQEASGRSVTCDCNMFKTQGICYHTGYRPRFRTKRRTVPRAIHRMYDWLEDNAVKHEREAREKEIRERQSRERQRTR